MTINSIFEEITHDLHELGMPAHIKGFYEIREAIEMIYHDPDQLNRMMKVYDHVAKAHDTSGKTVERNIRSAIDITWMRGDMDVITSIFHNTIDGRKARPTNKEFIVLLVDHLRIKNR